MVAILMVCCVPATSEMNTNIEVSAHYNGADATVIQLTDQYFPPYNSNIRSDNRKYSSAWAEFLAFKYNIPLHVFDQNVKGAMFKAFLQSGRGGASVYYPSCVTSYRKGKLDSIISEIASVSGRRPTTVSYGCGKTSYADSLPPYILGGRNSSFIHIKRGMDAITWYGTGYGNANRKNFIKQNLSLNRSSGGRFYSDITTKNITVTEAARFVETQVRKTVDTAGFYTNFMHWHDQYKNKKGVLIEGVAVMEQLFDAMNKGLIGSRNSYLDYNEAVEYLYAKESVNAVTLEVDSEEQISIKLTHSKKRERDYSVIVTPISIKIEKNTLQHFDIEKVAKQERIVSIFEDEAHYYVNILLNYEQKETNVILTYGEKNYEVLDLNQKFKIKKGILFNQVSGNMPAKFVLFRRKVGAKEFEIELVDRRSNFEEKYEPPNFEEGYDYFCGAITRTRQSALIHIKN